MHVSVSEVVPDVETLEDCQYACLRNLSCVSFDWTPSKNECAYLTDETMLSTRSAKPATLHFVLEKRCPIVGDDISYIQLFLCVLAAVAVYSELHVWNILRALRSLLAELVLVQVYMCTVDKHIYCHSPSVQLLNSST